MNNIVKFLLLTLVVASNAAFAGDTHHLEVKKEEIQINDYCNNIKDSIHNIIALRLLGVDFSESLSRFEDPILISAINKIYFNYTDSELKNNTKNIVLDLQNKVMKECHLVNNQFISR